jgi:basic membrane protein A
MTRFSKKSLAVILVLAMSIMVFTGCSSSKSNSTDTNNTTGDNSSEATPSEATPTEAAATEEETKEVIRVAQVLEGPISDMSWNATAYNGLKKIEALGAEISYQESVPAASVAESVRTYASEGYNIVYMTTNTFQDGGMEVAKDFPDVQFLICNGSQATDNFLAFQIADEEQGFLMGAVAALLTETGKVGFVGGSEIAPIIKGEKGFIQGVEYVNSTYGKSVEYSTAKTGSMEDTNKAKETALAMIEAGVDVVAPMANQSSSGVMQAAEEAGIMAIASGAGQETIAPNAEKVAVLKDTSVAYEASYKMYLDGTLPKEVFKMGAKEGVISLSEWFGNVSEDVKTQAADIVTKLAAGEITINLE